MNWLYTNRPPYRKSLPLKRHYVVPKGLPEASARSVVFPPHLGNLLLDVLLKVSHAHWLHCRKERRTLFDEDPLFKRRDPCFIDYGGDNPLSMLSCVLHTLQDRSDSHSATLGYTNVPRDDFQQKITTFIPL